MVVGGDVVRLERSTLREHVIQFSRFEELRGGSVVDGEFGEVGLTALDLGALFVADVVGEEAVLSFYHEVEALGAIYKTRIKSVADRGSKVSHL